VSLHAALRTCRECNAQIPEFRRWPNRLCRTCLNKRARVRYVAKLNGSIKTTDRVTRHCVNCKKKIFVLPHNVRDGRRGRFCSSVCYLEHTGRGKKILQCAECGKSFERFNCYGRSRKTRRFFCSATCQHSYNRGPNNPMWRGGRKKEPWRFKNWKRIAALVRKRDHQSCQVCGKTRRQNGRALAVVHIIPYRLIKHWLEIGLIENRDPNDPIGLLSLCDSCHGKKTQTERKIIGGDLVGFTRGSLTQLQHPRASMALEHYGIKNLLR